MLDSTVNVSGVTLDSTVNVSGVTLVLLRKLPSDKSNIW